MRKLAFCMHAGSKGEIDRLAWDTVFCCTLKGLGHHIQTQEQDSDKNNPGCEGRGGVWQTMFLYVGERFLCMAEESCLEF